MLKILAERLRQGHRTVAFPRAEPVLPERFRGRPSLDPSRCAPECRSCVEACPTDAIQIDGPGLRIDLGRCLFCGDCQDACPSQAIAFTQDFRLATRTRDDLVQLGGRDASYARSLDAASRRLFGRSLKLRQVSAGGCNACEADLNVLGTVVFDLGRFGIQFVASPRHADGIVVTGPVTENMRVALEETIAAVPAPKLIIAVGACALSGGPWAGHPEVQGGVDPNRPVLFVPGCPPHPYTLLDGLLRLLGRIEDGQKLA